MAQAPQLAGELPLARVDKAEVPEEICHMPPIVTQGERRKKKNNKKTLPRGNPQKQTFSVVFFLCLRTFCEISFQINMSVKVGTQFYKGMSAEGLDDSQMF